MELELFLSPIISVVLHIPVLNLLSKFSKNIFLFITLIEIEFSFSSSLSESNGFLYFSKLELSWNVFISSFTLFVKSSFKSLSILPLFCFIFFLFSSSSLLISLTASIIFCFFLIFLYKYLLSFKII